MLSVLEPFKSSKVESKSLKVESKSFDNLFKDSDNACCEEIVIHIANIPKIIDAITLPFFIFFKIEYQK